MGTLDLVFGEINGPSNLMIKKDKLHILNDVSKTMRKDEMEEFTDTIKKEEEKVITEAKRAEKEAKKKLRRELVLTIFCLN